MFNALASALAFFYEIWPSYGMSIILFTIAIMVLLTPLSIKSTRSMIRMQRLQPEMKKLQTKYKDDREALNREMMAFYSANNINPFSSCLPMLIQLPVFIVLFRVLRGLTHTDANGQFDPKYLSPSSSMYQALKGSTQMMSFGMDLSKSAIHELKTDGLVTALPYFVLVALVAGTQWYQQRQISGRQGAVATNPQQQMMTKILPFIIVPFALEFPAALVLYYVTSNLVRVGQQALLTREPGRAAIVIPPPGGTGAEAKPKPVRPKSSQAHGTRPNRGPSRPSSQNRPPGTNGGRPLADLPTQHPELSTSQRKRKRK